MMIDLSERKINVILLCMVSTKANNPEFLKEVEEIKNELMAAKKITNFGVKAV